jgi:hypothetical protein
MEEPVQLQVGTDPELFDPDDETIVRKIRSLPGLSTDAFAILTQSDRQDTYIQAVREDILSASGSRDVFIVEHRDAALAGHYRLSDVPLDTTAQLFLSYKGAGTAWKDDFPWQDVSAEFEWPSPARNDDSTEMVIEWAQNKGHGELSHAFTILAPNTPQQFVVVCLRCGVPCELQRPGFANAAIRTLLTGVIGFFASALDKWWRCNSCGRKYQRGDFKKGKIQQQRYTGTTMPIFRPPGRP